MVTRSFINAQGDELQKSISENYLYTSSSSLRAFGNYNSHLENLAVICLAPQHSGNFDVDWIRDFNR